MKSIQNIIEKGDVLMSSIDKDTFPQLSIEFISLLESFKFKPAFENIKNETLKDAQNLFGLHSWHPTEKTRKEVRKEIILLINCVDTTK